MDVSAALRTLDALSHETRLWAFRLLVQAGPVGLSAGDVAENLSIRQNTMSSHLKQLAAAGLIDSRRDGRSVFYRANYHTVQRLLVFLMEDCCGGHDAVRQPVAEYLAQRH
jgi:DNA-binding transcriptional ArsR family regulator